LEPVSTYDEVFAGAGDQAVRLEATPSYFYGGTPVVDAMQDVCGDDLRVLVVLREPVARLWSFFNYQKARLRIPEGLPIAEYLAHADELTDDDFLDPANECWFGFRGGCYADWLDDWTAAFGSRFFVAWFERLMNDPARVLTDVAEFLAVDPGAFPTTELASENRTTGYKRAGLQKVALGVNDKFERFLRRHYGLKEKLRSTYYRFNGATAKERLPDPVRAELAERYQEPNDRLRARVVDLGLTLPEWLEPEPSGIRGA
jgi:hypothetical protein